jgi:hypothetical protein
MSPDFKALPFHKRIALWKSAALSAPAQNAFGTSMVQKDKDAGRYPYSFSLDEPTPVLQTP